MSSVDRLLEIPSVLPEMPGILRAIVRSAVQLINADAVGLPTSAVATSPLAPIARSSRAYPLPVSGSGAFHDVLDTRQRRLHADGRALEHVDERVNHRLANLREELSRAASDHAGFRGHTQDRYERIARSRGDSGAGWPPWKTTVVLDHTDESVDRSGRIRGSVESRVEQAAQEILEAAPSGSTDADGGMTIARTGFDPEHVVISTTGRRDVVEIRQDPATLAVTVTVNGESRRIEEPFSKLTVESGDGNDTVTADTIDKRLQINAGSGDDTINFAGSGTIVRGGPGRDRITGQGADSYIEGGPDDDVILLGAGRNVVYAGSGDDVVHGGPDIDYVDGGLGNDEIRAGPGNDIVSGGPGDDTVAGDEGADRVVTGAGRDMVRVDGTGADVVFMQFGEDFVDGNGSARWDVNVAQIPDNLKVDGASERIVDDLNTFAAMPSAQDLLKSIGDSPHEVTIQEGQANGFHPLRSVDATAEEQLSPTGEPRAGLDGGIWYNPSGLYMYEEWKPPSVAFFHELVHGDDGVHGKLDARYYSGDDAVDSGRAFTGAIRNGERDAVGLPIDHDEDPRTPERVTRKVHENLLYDLFGLPRRRHYGPPP